MTCNNSSIAHLETVAPLRLLPDDVQHTVHQLGSWGMASIEGGKHISLSYANSYCIKVASHANRILN